MDIHGKFLFYVFYDNKSIELEILVVADESTSYDCVLGRDFLEKANLVLVSGAGVVMGDNIEADDTVGMIMSIDWASDGTQLTIGEDIDFVNRKRLNYMFDHYYIRPERPAEPRVKSEIRLILDDAKPFSCTPRRLSYDERQRLQVILDEYLEKGYIRPSE